MDSHIDSSIAEESHIISYDNHPEPKDTKQKRLKYATMKEIKNYERIAQTLNHRLLQQHPTLFHIDTTTKIHLVCTQNQQYYLQTDKKQSAHQTVDQTPGTWEIKVPVSNINKQSNLKIELARLRHGQSITIQNRKIRSGKPIRYRYSLTLLDKNLQLRVWVQLQGFFKIWKEMEVPQGLGKVTLEIHEFNSEQTDVKVNDFLFHLVLKMPFEEQSHYWILFDQQVQIERAQLTITPQGKIFDEMDTNCSKQCQLI